MRTAKKFRTIIIMFLLVMSLTPMDPNTDSPLGNLFSNPNLQTASGAGSTSTQCWAGDCTPELNDVVTIRGSVSGFSGFSGTYLKVGTTSGGNQICEVEIVGSSEACTGTHSRSTAGSQTFYTTCLSCTSSQLTLTWSEPPPANPTVDDEANKNEEYSDSGTFSITWDLADVDGDLDEVYVDDGSSDGNTGYVYSTSSDFYDLSVSGSSDTFQTTWNKNDFFGTQYYRARVVDSGDRTDTSSVTSVTISDTTSPTITTQHTSHRNDNYEAGYSGINEYTFQADDPLRTAGSLTYQWRFQRYCGVEGYGANDPLTGVYVDCSASAWTGTDDWLFWDDRERTIADNTAITMDYGDLPFYDVTGLVIQGASDHLDYNRYALEVYVEDDQGNSADGSHYTYLNVYRGYAPSFTVTPADLAFEIGTATDYDLIWTFDDETSPDEGFADLDYSTDSNCGADPGSCTWNNIDWTSETDVRSYDDDGEPGIQSEIDHWWKMNGATTDDWGSTNGALGNGAGWVTDAPAQSPFTQSLDLDGTSGSATGAQHMDVTVPAGWDSQRWSISVWFKFDTYDCDVLFKENEMVEVYRCGGADGSVLTYRTKNSGGSNQNDAGSTAIYNGNWYHVVVTYDGVTKKMYVNDNLDVNVATTSIPRSMSTFTFGSYPSTAYGMNGKIHDARYYDRVLHADEVSAIYNNDYDVGEGGFDDTATINIDVDGNTQDRWYRLVITDTLGYSATDYAFVDVTTAEDPQFSQTPQDIAYEETWTVGDAMVGPNLVNQWEFNSDVTDSWGSLDGSTVGSVTYVTGVFGNAIHLDGGTDYVQLGTSQPIDSTTAQATFSAWVNIESSLSSYHPILTKWGGGGSRAWWFGLHGTGSSTRIHHAQHDGTYTPQFSDYFDLQFDEWMHIGMVWSGTSLKYYINGLYFDSDTTASLDGSWEGNGAQIQIGHENSQNLDGSIDDVQFYTTALSDADMVKLATRDEQKWLFSDNYDGASYSLKRTTNTGGSYDCDATDFGNWGTAVTSGTFSGTADKSVFYDTSGLSSTSNPATYRYCMQIVDDAGHDNYDYSEVYVYNDENPTANAPGDIDYEVGASSPIEIDWVLSDNANLYNKWLIEVDYEGGGYVTDSEGIWIDTGSDDLAIVDVSGETVAGTYTYRITITDTAGNTDTDTVVVEVYGADNPTVDSPADKTSDAENNLKAWYNFNDNSKDHSGNGYDTAFNPVDQNGWYCSGGASCSYDAGNDWWDITILDSNHNNWRGIGQSANWIYARPGQAVTISWYGMSASASYTVPMYMDVNNDGVNGPDPAGNDNDITGSRVFNLQDLVDYEWRRQEVKIAFDEDTREQPFWIDGTIIMTNGHYPAYDVNFYLKDIQIEITETRNEDAGPYTSYLQDSTYRGPEDEVYTFGRSGSALLLNGNTNGEYAKLNPSAMANLGDFSVSMWVMFNQFQGTNHLLSVHDTDQGASNSILIATTSTTMYAYFDGVSAGSQSYSFSTYTWYHIAISRIGTQAFYFVNGVQVGGAMTVSDDVITAETIVLGQDQDSQEGGFDTSQALEGRIDDFKVYDIGLHEEAFEDIDRLQTVTWTIDDNLGDFYFITKSTVSEADALNHDSADVVAVWWSTFSGETTVNFGVHDTPVTTYFAIHVFDTLDNTVSDAVTHTVSSSSAPTVDDPADITYEEDDPSSYDMTYTFTDNHGLSSWMLLRSYDDGVTWTFQTDGDLSGTSDTTVIGYGGYTSADDRYFRMVVVDTFGNTAYSDQIIHVLVSTPPTWSATPTNEAYETSDQGYSMFGWWNFDNDLVGIMGGTGTWTGTSDYDIGSSSMGLEFNRDGSFVNLGDQNFAGTFGVSLWLNLDNDGSEHVVFHVDYQASVRILANGDFYWADSSDWSYANFGATDIDWTFGAWHHLFVFKDSSHDVHVYLDGVHKSTKNFGGAISDGPNPMIIGGYTAGGAPTQQSNGRIDDVKVFTGFDDDLPASFISNLYDDRVVATWTANEEQEGSTWEIYEHTGAGACASGTLMDSGSWTGQTSLTINYGVGAYDQTTYICLAVTDLAGNEITDEIYATVTQNQDPSSEDQADHIKESGDTYAYSDITVSTIQDNYDMRYWEMWSSTDAGATYGVLECSGDYPATGETSAYSSCTIQTENIGTTTHYRLWVWDQSNHRHEETFVIYVYPAESPTTDSPSDVGYEGTTDDPDLVFHWSFDGHLNNTYMPRNIYGHPDGSEYQRGAEVLDPALFDVPANLNFDYVIRFDGDETQSSWSGNDWFYSFMRDFNFTGTGETYVVLSVYQYVSIDVPSSIVARLSVEQSPATNPTGYSNNYDRNSDGTWQRLARYATIDPDGYVRFIPTYHYGPDEAFNDGYILIAGIQIEFGQTPSPYQPTYGFSDGTATTTGNTGHMDWDKWNMPKYQTNHWEKGGIADSYYWWQDNYDATMTKYWDGTASTLVGDPDPSSPAIELHKPGTTTSHGTGGRWHGTWSASYFENIRHDEIFHYSFWYRTDGATTVDSIGISLTSNNWWAHSLGDTSVPLVEDSQWHFVEGYVWLNDIDYENAIGIKPYMSWTYDSVHQAQTIYVSGITWSRENTLSYELGQYGSAGDFKGDSSTTLQMYEWGSGSDLEKSFDDDTFSISAWAYPHDTDSWSTIIQKNSSSAWYDWTLRINNANQWQFVMSYDGANWAHATYTTTITTNTWYHLVGTWDGEYLRLYVDGTLRDTTQLPGSRNTGGRLDGFNVGWYDDNPDSSSGNLFYYDGLIDDMKGYHGVLSDERVADLYAQPNPTVTWNIADNVNINRVEVIYSEENPNGDVFSVDYETVWGNLYWPSTSEIITFPTGSLHKSGYYTIAVWDWMTVSSPGQDTIFVDLTNDGWYVEYYDAPDLISGDNGDDWEYHVGELIYSEYVDELNWYEKNPNGETDTWVNRASAWVYFEYSETYTMYINTNDGGAIYVDGTEVVRDDTTHAPTEYSGTIAITEGWHYVEVYHFESTGTDTLEVRWSSTSLTKELITGRDTFAKVTPHTSFFGGTDLVAYYPFEYSAQDMTGVHDGVWEAEESYRPGVLGASAHFMGDPAVINIASDDWSLMEDEFTFATWFRVDEMPEPSEGTQALFGMNNRDGITITSREDGSFYVLFSNTDDSDAGAYSDLIITDAGLFSADHSWHHLVIKWSGGDQILDFYLDAQLVYTASTPNTRRLADAMSNPSHSQIGQYDDATRYFWEGGLDELSLWSRDISLQEMYDLYNLTRPHIQYESGDLASKTAGYEYYDYDGLNGYYVIEMSVAPYTDWTVVSDGEITVGNHGTVDTNQQQDAIYRAKYYDPYGNYEVKYLYSEARNQADPIQSDGYLSGEILYLPFNDNGQDYGVRDVTLTTTGTLNDQDFVVARGQAFDETDKVRIESGTSWPKPDEAITISFWFHTDDDLNGHSTDFSLWHAGTHSRVWYQTSTNTLRFTVYDNSEATWEPIELDMATYPIVNDNDAVYFVVAYVEEGTAPTMTIYNRHHDQIYTVTGGGSEIVGDLADITSAVDIAEDFDGAMDELRIHDRVLNQYEINHLLRTPTAYSELADNDLIAHWEFNGDWTDSAGSFDASIASGSPTFIKPSDTSSDFRCKLDGCAYFDGTDDWLTSSLDITTNRFSVSAWVYYESWDDAGGFGESIIHEETGNNYGWNLGNEWGKPDFAVRGDDTTIRHAGYGTNGDNYLSRIEGQWSHWVGVYDGRYMRFYLNGDHKETFEHTGMIKEPMATTSVEIGGNNGGSPFNGYIDDLRIYDVAISNTMIQSLYGLGSDMYAWYSFDAVFTSDNRYYEDSHGWGYDATFTGTPGYTSGVVSNAFDFPGTTSDYMTLPADVLDGKRDFSITFTVNTDDWDNGGSGLTGLVSGATSSYTGGDNEIIIYGRNIGINFGIRGQERFFGGTLVDGQDHQITVTRRGETAEVYLDGVSLGSQTHDYSGPLDVESLVIGQEQDGVGGGFSSTQLLDGWMDNLGFFHEALESEQVRSLASLSSYAHYPRPSQYIYMSAEDFDPDTYFVEHSINDQQFTDVYGYEDSDNIHWDNSTQIKIYGGDLDYGIHRFRFTMKDKTGASVELMKSISIRELSQDAGGYDTTYDPGIGGGGFDYEIGDADGFQPRNIRMWDYNEWDLDIGQYYTMQYKLEGTDDWVYIWDHEDAPAYQMYPVYYSSGGNGYWGDWVQQISFYWNDVSMPWMGTEGVYTIRFTHHTTFGWVEYAEWEVRVWPDVDPVISSPGDVDYQTDTDPDLVYYNTGGSSDRISGLTPTNVGVGLYDWGVRGQALHYKESESDYISYANMDLSGGTSGFTFGGWFMFKTLNSYDTLFSIHTQQDTAPYFWAYAVNGYLYMQGTDGVARTTAGGVPHNIQVGRWTYISYSVNFDDDTLVIMQDGIPLEEYTINWISMDQPRTFYLGSYSTTSHYSDIHLDEYKIWTRALTNAEMQAEYFNVNYDIYEVERYYSFDGENALDSSGQDVHGSISGSVTYSDNEGIIGDALIFTSSSSDYFNMPDVTMQEGMTMNWWMKPTGLPTADIGLWSGFAQCCDTVSSYTASGLFDHQDDEGHYYTNNAGTKYMQPTPTEMLNSWQMITFVFRDTQIDFFINGTFVGYNSYTQNPLLHPNHHTFDRFGRGYSSEQFEGMFDELKIWTTSFSPGMVGKMFTETMNMGGIDGLISHYRMEGDLTDSSQSQHDLVQYGTPSGYTSGMVGQAGTVDDSDNSYLQASNLHVIPEYRRLRTYTVSFWMQYNEDAFYSWHDALYLYSPNRSWAMYINGAGNTKIHFSPSSGGEYGYTFTDGQQGFSWMDGQYHHVSGTWDGMYITIYLDGQLMFKSADYSDNWVFDDWETTPRYIKLGDGEMDANFDEVKVHDYALTTAEVVEEYNKASIDNSLLFHYEMDGSWDNQMPGYDLTQTNSGGQYISAPSGSGYEFELGSEYLSTSTSDIAGEQWDEFSLSVFFKLNEFSPSSQRVGVVHSWDWDDEGFSLSNYNAQTNMQFNYASGGGTYATFSLGSSNLDLRQWEHYVITFDYTGNEIKFYRNGILTLTDTPDNPLIMEDNLYIGRSIVNAFDGMNGTVGEVRIYNRTISDIEVQGIWQQQQPYIFWDVYDNRDGESYQIYEHSSSGACSSGTMVEDGGWQDGYIYYDYTHLQEDTYVCLSISDRADNTVEDEVFVNVANWESIDITGDDMLLDRTISGDYEYHQSHWTDGAEDTARWDLSNNGYGFGDSINSITGYRMGSYSTGFDSPVGLGMEVMQGETYVQYLEVRETDLDLSHTEGTMALSVWYQRLDTDGGSIFSKPWNGNGEYNYRLGIESSGRLLIGTEGTGVGQVTYSDELLEYGTWYHLVMVFQDDEVSLMVNGVEWIVHTHTASWTPDNPDISQHFALGTVYPYGNTASSSGRELHMASGRYADFRVFDKQLTPFEIQSLYHQGNRQIFRESQNGYPLTWNIYQWDGSNWGSPVYTSYGTEVRYSIEDVVSDTQFKVTATSIYASIVEETFNVGMSPTIRVNDALYIHDTLFGQTYTTDERGMIRIDPSGDGGSGTYDLHKDDVSYISGSWSTVDDPVFLNFTQMGTLTDGSYDFQLYVSDGTDVTNFNFTITYDDLDPIFAIDDSDLQIHMPFDGNFEDVSDNRVATATGDITYDTGKYGEAIDFDQGEYLTVPNFQLAESWSMAIWIKQDTQTYNDGFLDMGTYQARGFSFFGSGSGEDWFLRWNYASTHVQGTILVNAVLDTWYHIGITYYYDGANYVMQSYINGNPGISLSNANPMAPPTEDLWIGKRDSRTLDGNMDDYRYYDRQLSDDEFSALYNSGNGVKFFDTEEYSYGDTNNILQWDPVDNNGGTYVLKRDSVTIASGSFGSHSSITHNADGLVAGTYVYEMIATDSLAQTTTAYTILTVHADRNSPTLSTIPSDDTIATTSTGNTLDYYVSDISSGTYDLYRNDVLVGDDVAWSPGDVSISIDGLSADLYNFTVIFTDSYGNSISDEVWIEVISDNGAPQFVITADDANGADAILRWGAVDQHEDYYEIRINGDLVFTGSWTSADFINVDMSDFTLNVGANTVQITVYDTLGNTAVDSATVTVT